MHMDANILINLLQNGERITRGEGETSFTEVLPPTRTALHAARALKQLVDRINMDQQTIINLQNQINSLLIDITNLQQLEEPNETKVSSTAVGSSCMDSTEPSNNLDTN